MNPRPGIQCEWGLHGIEALAPSTDVFVIVDVLSFTTCVEIAVARGAVVYPYRWKDDSATEYAHAMNAMLAGPRGEGLSLSPASLDAITPGTRLVLPSPNGAALSLATGTTPTIAGCFRNAAAVASAARKLGPRVSVIPAGERWPDGTLRPCLEDWLGAGAVIRHLAGSRSPEAEAARLAFESLAPSLGAAIEECMSGRELTERGFATDVVLAAELDVSETVPRLSEGAYRRRE